VRLQKTFKDTGIIIGIRDFGEADRILTIYSKNNGKITLLAKSARLPKSRKRGAIDSFNLVQFSAQKAKGVGYISEIEIIDGFKEIKLDIKRTSVAYFCLEVLSRLTQYEEKNEVLFTMLADALESLKYQNNLKNLRNEFTQKIVVLLGYWPHDKELEYPDRLLEEIAERQFTTVRVGKRIQQ
jgi:DNA repair protein RecO (recombination protein O)